MAALCIMTKKLETPYHIISLFFFIVLPSSCELPDKVVLPGFELNIYGIILCIFFHSTSSCYVFCLFVFIATWHSANVFFVISSFSIAFPEQTDPLPPCPRDNNATTDQVKMLFLLLLFQEPRSSKIFSLNGFTAGCLHLHLVDILVTADSPLWNYPVPRKVSSSIPDLC